jgi:hypothetical protein
MDTGSRIFDVMVTLTEEPADLICSFEYDRDLFEPATIGRMRNHFRILFEGIVANPETRISALPLLSEMERRQILVGWNQTEAEYPNASIPELGDPPSIREFRFSRRRHCPPGGCPARNQTPRKRTTSFRSVSGSPDTPTLPERTRAADRDDLRQIRTASSPSIRHCPFGILRSRTEIFRSSPLKTHSQEVAIRAIEGIVQVPESLK